MSEIFYKIEVFNILHREIVLKYSFLYIIHSRYNKCKMDGRNLGKI